MNTIIEVPKEETISIVNFNMVSVTNKDNVRLKQSPMIGNPFKEFFNTEKNESICLIREVNTAVNLEKEIGADRVKSAQINYSNRKRRLRIPGHNK